MFAYVVLHYISAEITTDCVDHILQLSDNSTVVIVDNCSPNNSGEQLSNHYKNETRVAIVINKRNEGFARGNNIGYQFAKKNYNPEYIVVSNNDVIINQHNFEKTISSFMDENGIDVCGPDILTPDNFHQNPLALSTITTRALKKTIFFYKIKIALFSVPLFFNLYAKYRRKNKVIVGSEFQPNDTYDCVLHGSFIVFGKKYIFNEPHAFLPVTNMYGEEYILYDYLKIKAYQIGICSKAQILHLGGKSTTHQWGDLGRTKFRFKNTTDSLVVLLKLREQYLKDGYIYKK